MRHCLPITLAGFTVNVTYCEAPYLWQKAKCCGADWNLPWFLSMALLHQRSQWCLQVKPNSGFPNTQCQVSSKNIKHTELSILICKGLAYIYIKFWSLSKINKQLTANPGLEVYLKSIFCQFPVIMRVLWPIKLKKSIFIMFDTQHKICFGHCWAKHVPLTCCLAWAHDINVM